MKSLTITLLFSAFSLLATAQTFDDNFFNNFEKSYQKDPVQFLKNDNTPDFTIVYGDGRLGNKESVLKIYEALNQVSRTVTELKTRQLGNTGIATGILNHTYTAKQDGSPRDYTNRFTHTFALQKGKWNLVAVHFTDMPPMPPFTEQRLLDMNKRLIQDFAKFVSEEVSPEYSFTTADGATLTYQAMKDAKIKVLEWNTHDLKIKQIGNVAIVRGINDHIIQSTTSNEMSKYSVHFIYTFEYKKDKWLWLTAHHIYNTPSKAEDETAIKTVLEAETKAAYAGDMLLSNWYLTPKTRFVATTATGQAFYGGSGEEVRKLFSDNLKPSNNTAASSNYNIQIATGGKMAWATYDQTTRDKDGKTVSLSHEIRCLEKVNGAWKVVVVSAHFYKQ
jgi:ketosteroid isomerase-like protein